MIKAMIVFLYLAVLSVCDIRNMKVPAWMIWGGILCGSVYFLVNGIMQKTVPVQMLYEGVKAVSPGCFLLAAALFTKKAGAADGILLITLGLLYGGRWILFSGCVGLWGMSLVSAGLMLLHKADKDTKLPYIPFLTIGQAFGVLFFR